MKILLLIINLLYIKSLCPSSCLCSNPTSANEDTMYCISCYTGFFPLDLDSGIKNCYPDNSIIKGYYFNREDQKFKKCDISCERCTGDGNTNCIICNNDEDYYSIEGNEDICRKKNSDAVKGFYLDEDEKIFKACYSNCATCEEGGDSNNNHCLSCRDDYFKNGENCVSDCPEELFRLENFCVSSCEERAGYYMDLFSKKCVNICPEGMKENDELWLCTIERTSLFKDYDCDNIIQDYIEPKMEFFISDNSLIIGKNCYIQVYNSLDQFVIHNVAEKYMISKLFLNDEYIKNDIIVIKVDYNQTYKLQPEVNDVKFNLYYKSAIIANKYNLISDLDLITTIDSDDLIYIEKPFIYTENIQLYEKKYEIFDIFNARNEIYNNICISFKSEYSTDVTYDYRRDVYFVDLSQYCLNDSTIYYSSFISDFPSVQCKANYIENHFIEEKVGDSRFKIFKCKKYIQKLFLKSYGFWVILFFIIFYLVIFIMFLITRFKSIVSFMRVFERGYNKPTGLKLQWTVLNPPKKKIKVIYKPKEFILSDDFFEEENELKYKLNLFKNLKNRKKNENEKITNLGKNKNKTIYESKNSKRSLSSSDNNNINNTENNNKDNISYSKSSNSNSINSSINNTSSMDENKRKEIEEKEKERINKENQKFKEDWAMKEKNKNEKMKYKTFIMPHPEIKSIMKEYSEKQKKIIDNAPKPTNLLKLNDFGNVVLDKPPDNLKMKYEPKQYLDQYMFHNYAHLLPIPKSERVSSGTLSSDIRNELLKLQQLREKQMVERIFLKKIMANQKLLKGYNEDFYPFSFDECIIRRKENVTYKIIFWNYLREINLIVNVFYDENYLESRIMKISVLGFSIYSMLFFNLLLYEDRYINDFYNHKGKLNFFYQITKSFYSSLITSILVKVMLLLVSSKNKLRKIIIRREYESDKNYIHDYKITLIILAIKISGFFLIFLVFLLFGWFYYICFSIPYPQSQKHVLLATLFSLLIYEILSIGVIALASGFKYSSIKSQSRKLYNAMMIANLFL